MTDKPKLLWHSNASHSPTGYGQQTALFTQKLKDRYDLGISAFYGLEGNVLKLGGIPTYPGIGLSYGNETIMDHATVHFGEPRGGLVVTLMDVWPLEPAIWRQLNVASWVPVDHQPVPPPVAEFFAGSTAVPIAMSRFGEEQLHDAGLDALYCPHAVDGKAYRPYPQDEARKATGIPEGFVVGMVAANKGNPSRKAFPECLTAFKAFHDRHPESRLYLHTEALGRFDGVNLPDLIRAIGLDPDAVLFPDQYRVVHYPYSHERMAQTYSSLDVLLAASNGEGFGLPTIEAQACGVPVIVSDFAASPELVGAGWKVSGQRHYTPLKAWQFRPDPDDILDALNQAYRAPKAQREFQAKKAREFAEGYHVDRVLDEFMLPALEQVAERFEERKPVELVAA